MSAPAKSHRAQAGRDGTPERDGIRLPEALFREVNERIVSLQGDVANAPLALVCECRNVDCSAAIHLAPADYEAIRRFPTRFIVKRRHERIDTDRIVDDRGDTLVIEKWGAEGIVALRTDARRHRRGAKPHDPGRAGPETAEEAHAQR